MDTQTFQHLLPFSTAHHAPASALLAHYPSPNHLAGRSTPRLSMLPSLSGRGAAWLPGVGVEAVVIAANSVCAPVPFSPRRLWLDFARHNAGKTAQALIDGLTVRRAAGCKTPPSCGVTASTKAMASRRRHGKGYRRLLPQESFKGQRGLPCRPPPWGKAVPEAQGRITSRWWFGTRLVTMRIFSWEKMNAGR